jgi:hypothetical protein
MQFLISRAGRGNNNIGAVTKTASNSLEPNHQLTLQALLPFKEDTIANRSVQLERMRNLQEI